MLRKMAGALAIALAISVGASAEAASYSKNLKGAAAAAKAGDMVTAMLAVEDPIRDLPSDRPAILKALNKTKNAKELLLTNASQTDGMSAIPYERAYHALEAAELVGLLDDATEQRALVEVSDHFRDGLLAGRVKAGVHTDPDLLGAVDEPSVNLALLKNSMADSTIAPFSDNDLEQLIAFSKGRAGSDQLTGSLKAGLPGMAFKRDALEHSVADIDASFAAAALDAFVTDVYVDATGADGLLVLDLRDALKRDEHIRLVDSADRAEEVLNLRQLALEIERRDETTHTIAYKQYEVNFLAAALLMPDNATYQYEVQEAGYDYEYAFELGFADRAGASLGPRQVVRDKGQLLWSACLNQRVVNVFGGSQPATWMANSDMQTRCGAASQKPTQSDVRSKIVDQLAAQIIQALPKAPTTAVTKVAQPAGA